MEIETIRISFRENEQELLHIVLVSQPFKVGERIDLSVENKDPKKWDVENLETASYEITEIEHMVRLSYLTRISQYVDVFVRVKRV